LEVIVTAPPLPAEETPDCIIVNPNQQGCGFPSKNLAGVGVIFYVLTALRDESMARTDKVKPAAKINNPKTRISL